MLTDICWPLLRLLPFLTAEARNALKHQMQINSDSQPCLCSKRWPWCGRRNSTENPSLSGRNILFGSRGGAGPLLPRPSTQKNEARALHTRGKEKTNTNISDQKGMEGNLLNLFRLISLNHVKTKPKNVLHSGLCPTQCAN